MRSPLKRSVFLLIVFVATFFGVQIYTSNVYCKKVIPTPNWIQESQINSFYSPTNGECYAVISTVSSVRCQIACETAWGMCGCGMSANSTTVLYEVNGAYLIDQWDYNPNLIKMALNKLGFWPVWVSEHGTTQQTKEEIPGQSGRLVPNPLDN